MTVSEFIKKNNDILTGVVKESDMENLTDGTVLFVVITAPGQREIANRVVRSAGYYLIVSRTSNHVGQTTSLTLIGLTAGGYAKVESINIGDLDGRGNKAVFFCNPLPKNDIRRNYNFMN